MGIYRKLCVCMGQETTYWGQKFRIFLEKAIIDLKHHSRHFSTEDFYIFIFFDIYRQEHILVLIYLPFFVVVLVLILITWTCNMRLSGLIQCQCVIISHILLLYFILSEPIHAVSTPANNNGPTPYQLFPMMMMSSLLRLFLRTPFSNFFLFSLPL